MLSDDLLENRLQSYKNRLVKKEETVKEKTSKPKQVNSEASSTEDAWREFIMTMANVASLFLKTFAFGYSLKVLALPDLQFLGYMSIGLSINFLFEYIKILFNKTKTS